MVEKARGLWQAARAGLASLAVAALAVCAIPGVSAGPEPRLETIAEGVYVFQGAIDMPTAGNRGETADVAFVVGRGGAIAIDTGASTAHAAGLEAALARLAGARVSLAVNTGVNAERIFGNGHYADRGVPISAHPDATRLMQERCEICLTRLRREVGEAPFAGTRLALPTQGLAGGEHLHAGDRELRVLYFGWSASPGAIALFDPATRTLFAGALAAFGRVPEVRDAKLDRWVTAIDELIALAPARVVPGWGPVGTVEDLKTMRAYFLALRARVASLLDQGVSLGDATSKGGIAAYESWPLYDPVHRRNVHDVYLALERDWFTEEPGAR